MGRLCYNRISRGDELRVRAMLSEAEAVEEISVIATSQTIGGALRQATRLFRLEGYRYVEIENVSQGWRALYYKNGVKL